MAATLTLNKFELMWLFEGAAGKSHLRWDIYPLFADTIYRQLNDDEREFLYTYIKRDTSWLWENKTGLDETPYKYWLQVLARYNPANQYEVTLKGLDGKEIVSDNAYYWDGKYHVGWYRYCAPENIVNVKRKPYKKCSNTLCKANDTCLRFLEYKKGDKLFDDVTNDGSEHSWYCENCDCIIEKEQHNK